MADWRSEFRSGLHMKKATFGSPFYRQPCLLELLHFLISRQQFAVHDTALELKAR